MNDYRYVMFCSSAPHWLELGISLKNSMGAEPALWIGDDAHYDKAKSFFGASVVKKLSDLRYAAESEQANYDGSNNNFFLSNEYSTAKDLCIKMMDRLDDSSTFNRLDREVWFHNVCIWTLNHFSNHPPNALIMSEAPHNHAQYAIFEICKYLKIPILKFSAYTPIPCLTASIWEDDKYVKIPIANENKIKKDNLKVKAQLQEAFKKYLDLTFDRLVSKKTGEAPLHLALLKTKSNSINFHFETLYGLFKDSFRFIKYPKNWFRFNDYKGTNPFKLFPLFIFFASRLRKFFLKVELKKYTDSESAMKNEKYVYYPLHYEPERTTNPDGGIYQDQLINIILLRKYLPSSVKIVVKEHPAQFMSARTGYRGRSPLFYRQLKNISGLILLPPKVRSDKLIESSIAVATISGTVGFEAACIQKKCILFGETWFKGMPNCYDFDLLPSFKDFMKYELSNRHQIEEYFHDVIEQYGLPGFQNLSALPRIEEHLTTSFITAQDYYLLSTCKYFLNNNDCTLSH
tara:strand:- start:500 stop:2047 length:1548 start_codon:yes stop_codon:yes gene_type:complete